MKETVGDLWTFWKSGAWIIVPTNGSTGRSREAIMGRGVAAQARRRFPSLPHELGERLRRAGNFPFVFSTYHLFTFPVKWWFWEDADLELIRSSCLAISMMTKPPIFDSVFPIYLPRVGCGAGRRRWEEVKPILERYLDERFIAVSSL